MLWQEPIEASASGPSPAARSVRKTLSRRSPYLPEVLPNLIDYADITLDTAGRPRRAAGRGLLRPGALFLTSSPTLVKTLTPSKPKIHPEIHPSTLKAMHVRLSFKKPKEAFNGKTHWWETGTQWPAVPGFKF